ncbi:hypothetical protein AC249_AIPGENE23188 [Exaiptasia diaphana]|nr:hypothetical protein AC249_AIPGENE23188 [Exaiptasia diaphana]
MKISNSLKIRCWTPFFEPTNVEKLNEPHKNFAESNANPATPVQPGKRKLRTPDRGASPSESKSNKQKSDQLKSRKSLFKEAKEDSDDPDIVLNKLNIDDLKQCEGRSSVKLKVLLVHPNGDVDVKNPTNSKVVQVIKNIANSQWTGAVNGLLDHPDESLQRELQTALQRRVNREFVAYSKSDSVLKATKGDELAAFSNKLVAVEARTQCPLWDACIRGDTGAKGTVNELALMTAIAARTRNPTMSAVAFRISSILVHSGARFEDIRRLNNLGVCMSPKSAVRMQKSMGETFDSKVLKWKSEIEENKGCIQLLGEVIEKQTPPAEEDSMDLEITFDIREEVLKAYRNYNPSVYGKIEKVFGSERKLISEECMQNTIHQLKGEKLPFYKLVADNIDIEVQSRIQSTKTKNKSLHWTHQFALLNKVHPPHKAESPTSEKTFDLMDILPTAQVQKNLMKRMAVLVSRVIIKYLSHSLHLKGLCNTTFLMNTQKQWKKNQSLLCRRTNPNMSQYYKMVLLLCSFHGDQLFEERSRNVQWTFRDGQTDVERLVGLEPEFADWHAKFTLYKAENKLFVNHSSASEVGTTMASINRTGKSNAAKDCHNHYNEYNEFHSRETEAHICASFMEKMKMDTMDAEPNVSIPGDSISESTRRQWLDELCSDFVREYVFDANEIDGLIDKTAELDQRLRLPFLCRSEHCHKSYKFHSARVR